MQKRSPVSGEQNIWYDAQDVDNDNLTLEQDYNNQKDGALINNHIGNGVLIESLDQNVIFDSVLVSGLLDGVALEAQNQPTDNNYGNQLEVQLSDSKVAGNRKVKVLIIGLDFEQNMQYETFIFSINEKQVSYKHFASVLLILVNDLLGEEEQSFNLGGRLTIKETKPMSLSRDPVMVSQESEPNLFFRDFFISDGSNVVDFIEASLPTYNTSNLNIKTTYLEDKILLKDDVTTQIGQKFKATTNNIQKVSLLLSVRNTELGSETDLSWNGDIVVSIYPLQTSIDCPTDIAPGLDIEFAPQNTPISQVSFNYSSLYDRGIVLNGVPQPVDFIFSNSSAASGNSITANKYYAVTIKRSGSANKCDILVACGEDNTTDSQVTIFTGNLWVDIPEQDLWFKIYTDSAKVSDGQGYENGNGLNLPKTKIDESSGSTIDNIARNYYFSGNDVYRAIVQGKTDEHSPVQSEITGNPINSKKEIVPEVSLLSSVEIASLESTSNLLSLGAISDKNIKYYDSANSLIESNLNTFSLINNEMYLKVVDDTLDEKYDATVVSLVSSLLNGDLINAKINPNSREPNTYYRIAKAELCTLTYGDINGDGLIDEDDIELLNKYIGFDFNLAPGNITSITTDGYTTTFKNGYVVYKNAFTTSAPLNFQLVDTTNGNVIASGTDGVLVADPNDPSLAQFTSSSVQFNTIIGLSSYKLVITTTTPQENCGGFSIVSINSVTDVLTIQKIYLTTDTFLQLFAAEIDGDYQITSNDGYLLTSYINKSPYIAPITYTYPVFDFYTKIGTKFNVIKLVLEPFVDRTDDYFTNLTTRNNDIHTVPDIFTSDGYFNDHSFDGYAVNISINKQLSWKEELVVVNSKYRPVSTIFNESVNLNNFLCTRSGHDCITYPVEIEYEEGRVDYFIPGNVIIKQGGELVRDDGYLYKVDFEVGTILLEIPNALFNGEKTINVFDEFIANYDESGRTRKGFPAMRFADCSFVETDALSKDQVRFSVAVQSFSPNLDGYSVDGYEGVIVDGKIGVNINYETGLLSLNFSNLYDDPILSTLTTKIQVQVFLKKAGFNNRQLFVDSTKVGNLLNLSTIFNSSSGGGALLDLESGTTGVLPIIHGGTGLNSVGANGTVLVSNGTSLSYQFVCDLLSMCGLDGYTDLTTDVIGVLPIANGGTGMSTVGANGSVLTSNGTSIVYYPICDLINDFGCSTPVPVIVYRPGSTTVDNSYATWTEVMTAFAATQGLVYICFDDQGSTPASIPSGNYNFQWRAVFVGLPLAKVAVDVTMTNGAQCQNVIGFQDLAIDCQAISGNYNFTWTTGAQHIRMFNTTFYGSGDSVGYGLAVTAYSAYFHLLNGSKWSYNTSAVALASAFTTMYVYVDASSKIENNVVDGAGLLNLYSLGVDALIGTQSGITTNDGSFLRKHIPRLPDTNVYYGVAGTQVADTTTYETIGVVDINPSILPSTAMGGITQTITFKAVVQVVATGTTVTIHLLNESGVEVTSSAITSTVAAETAPEKLSASLTIGSAPNITNDRRAYQVQIKRNGGVGGDQVICYSAMIEVAYSTT